MIIGEGLIASAFRPYFGDDVNTVVFASGVSNSRESRKEEFLREKRILMECLSQKKLTLYFSTCSVNDLEMLDTPYVIHKKEMEALVRSTRDHAIFRLPQVVGRTSNPNTLTNYLFNHIKFESPFQVWRHAKRNLIDVDDIARIVSYLVRASLANGITTDIACPFSLPILELVHIFESIVGKSARYTIVEAGCGYSIDSTMTIQAAGQIDIDFSECYVEKLIRKYYA